MTYRFEPGQMYRMPTHFGPSSGPRQGENGQRFLNLDTPKRTVISVSFLTNKDQLTKMLPDRFELESEPVVTVQFQYIKDIEWLAGRGYNVVGVSFLASFNGRKSRVVGDFLPILWENLADPIITGREELGFSKLFCDIPETRKLNGITTCTADWMGFKFLDMEIRNIVEVSPGKIKSSASINKNDGILHYKYMPRTGDWGDSDAEYAVLTPSGNSKSVITEAWVGEGAIKFHKATWQDLPTMHNIVNNFAKLEIIEYRGAKLTKTVGGEDLRKQRILK